MAIYLLGLKADKNSPSFTGDVSFDKASTVIGLNEGFVPIGTIISHSSTNIPPDYLVCDGSEYKTIFGISSLSTYPIGSIVGTDSITLTTSNLPNHTHSGTVNINSSGIHTHSFTTQPSGAHIHSVTGNTNDSGSHIHSSSFGTVGYTSGYNASQEAVSASSQNNGTKQFSTLTAGNHNHAFQGQTSIDWGHTHSGSTDSSSSHVHTGTISIDSSGSGASFNIIPRNMKMIYIIKAKYPDKFTNTAAPKIIATM